MSEQASAIQGFETPARASLAPLSTAMRKPGLTLRLPPGASIGPGGGRTGRGGEGCRTTPVKHHPVAAPLVPDLHYADVYGYGLARTVHDLCCEVRVT
jgi:hypothetical protein